jgi:hypothetical protein
MKYQDFHNKFYKEILPNKDFNLRNGQTLMIFLSEVWFAEYKRMTAKFAENVDCFYNDNLIPAALNHLQNNWYKFYDDIKKIYYIKSDITETDNNFTYLTGEREVVCYYINNNEIVSLFDLNISVIDNTEDKVKQELNSLGFSENICLVKL